MCNCIKFETGRNLVPVLKIVTHTEHAAYIEISYFVNVAKCACVLFLVIFPGLRASI